MKFQFNRPEFGRLSHSWQSRRRASFELTPRKKLLTFFAVVSLISFIFGFKFRNLIPAATVNGEMISRRDFSEKLLKRSGQTVLNELVTEKLLLQEAKRQNVVVTKKEINEKINLFKRQLLRQGLKEESELAQNKKTRPILEREMRNQLLIEKLFGKNMAITDQSIEKYLESNNIRKGTAAIWESQKIAVNQILYQQRLQQRFLSWLDLKKKDARVRVLLSI